VRKRDREGQGEGERTQSRKMNIRILLFLSLLLPLATAAAQSPAKEEEGTKALTKNRCEAKEREERGREAYVVVLASEDYLPGLLATLFMLRESGTFRRIIVLSSLQLPLLPPLCNRFRAELRLIGQRGNPRDNSSQLKAVSYTKLEIWNLPDVPRAVFLDLDLLLLDNLDELFDMETDFAAAPDGYPPSLFNSGVMVFRPDPEVHRDMVEKVALLPSYDGTDQGFLNSYYSGWFESREQLLHPRYNAKGSNWCYVPWALEALAPLKVIHFAGCTAKPWQNAPYGSKLFHDRWMEVYDRAKTFAFG